MIPDPLQIAAYFKQGAHIFRVFTVRLIDNDLGDIFTYLFVEKINILLFLIHFLQQLRGTLQHCVETQAYVLLCHLKHSAYLFAHSCQNNGGCTDMVLSLCIHRTNELQMHPIQCLFLLVREHPFRKRCKIVSKWNQKNRSNNIK